MQPLAERLRPKTLDEYIGQKHLVGPGAVLRKMIDAGRISSFILWGPPGVGKTTLALAFSKSMALKQNRMQFTTDVLPSDVIGFSMYNAKTQEFEFKEGAVMCNLFLADEINRTSSKTQLSLIHI